MNVTIDVSPGELLDRITILEIKSERLSDPDKLANVRHALELLRGAREGALADGGELRRIEDELKLVNGSLWDIEDEIRACEAGKDFGERFVELARSVYHENDRRSRLKRRIDEILGSDLVEEKFLPALLTPAEVSRHSASFCLRDRLPARNCVQVPLNPGCSPG